MGPCWSSSMLARSLPSSSRTVIPTVQTTCQKICTCKWPHGTKERKGRDSIAEEFNLAVLSTDIFFPFGMIDSFTKVFTRRCTIDQIEHASFVFA